MELESTSQFSNTEQSWDTCSGGSGSWPWDVLLQGVRCGALPINQRHWWGRGTVSVLKPGCASQLTWISVQFSPVAQSCPTLCNPMDCSTPGLLSIINSWSLLKLMSIELVMPSNRLILRHPLFLPPSIFPSIRVFSNESTLRIRWPNYWSFSFSISPSNEYSGLISFRIDWLDLAVQRTLKSSPTLQFKSINSLSLRFLSSPTLTSIHDYWKNHSFDQMDLCQQNKVSAFYMMSRLVIALLPRSKHHHLQWF